jgi:hypothetical protein
MPMNNDTRVETQQQLIANANCVFVGGKTPLDSLGRGNDPVDVHGQGGGVKKLFVVPVECDYGVEIALGPEVQAIFEGDPRRVENFAKG